MVSCKGMGGHVYRHGREEEAGGGSFLGFGEREI